MRIGPSFGSGTSNGRLRLAPMPVAAGEDQFAAMLFVTPNMAAGKMTAVAMEFAASCAFSIKFYNSSGGAQIGVTKTGTHTFGTPSSVSGVTTADGIIVDAKYTCTTTAPGFKAVTVETLMFTMQMVNGSGDMPVEVPDNPVG